MSYGIVIECRGFNEEKKKIVIEALEGIGIKNGLFGSYFGNVNYIGTVARDGKICQDIQVTCRASKPQKERLTSFDNLMMLARMNFTEDGQRDFRGVLQPSNEKTMKSMPLADYAKKLEIYATKIDRTKSRNKYDREIVPGVFVDVYDILGAFKTDSPAVDHAVKKLLAMGKRGHKDRVTDLKEAIASIEREIAKINEWSE